jgi:hypothetical protein
MSRSTAISAFSRSSSSAGMRAIGSPKKNLSRPYGHI